MSYNTAFLESKGNIRKGANCTVLPMHTFCMVVITVNIHLEAQREKSPET